MGNPPRDAEILIKRDANKKNKINPKNTKVILKLETGELGELGIEMDINEENVGFQFNTLNDETKTLIMAQMEELRRKLELRNYKTKVIKVVKKSLNTKDYLMPSLDLDNLMRVQTEA
jgi:flagellar hook-length control protein FliK